MVAEKASKARNKRWKRITAVAACFIVIGSTFTITFSSEAKAWAFEKAANIVSQLQTAVNKQAVKGDDDGSKVERSLPDNIMNPSRLPGSSGKGQYNIVYGEADETIEEAEDHIGFDIRLPAYLPENCSLPEKIIVGDFVQYDKDKNLVKTGKHAANIILNDISDSFQGMYMVVSQNGGELMGSRNYRVVEIGSLKVREYNAEICISLKDSKEEKKIIPECRIFWEQDGLTYLLVDYTGTPIEEIYKMIGSMK
jgi:hypothetical protein